MKNMAVAGVFIAYIAIINIAFIRRKAMCCAVCIHECKTEGREIADRIIRLSV